ncbi:ribulokinase [Leadbetterella sp. DM7]|uniref:ribulokinase n=1 Tax=Leadbetterella sp. DM7 TaxID=3235085 RepID=UPI00349E76B2
MNDMYTIGIDFGTDSVRAVVVNTANGQMAGTAVSYYKRWKAGRFCDAAVSQFRQHPKDYLEAIEEAVTGALAGLTTQQKQNVKGISIDTTGSTVVAVNEDGTPLSLLPEFAENPHAMFILWKDHTANREAEEINHTARQSAVDYTRYVGGIYSSEWFWAKILKTYRTDQAVRQSAFSWVEHCDWMSAVLTGNTRPLEIRRSRCAAGHKAMWNEEFEGLPPEEFLVAVDPLLGGLRERLYRHTFTSDEAVGHLSAEWAGKFGLPENVVVGVGAFDCHMGAVGAEITPYAFVRVMGTSTCDILTAPLDEMKDTLVKGICGQVDGSVVPGYLGMEAGQSAYGDYYAWFQRLLTGPVRAILGEAAANEMADKILPYLSEEAFKLPVSENDVVATDWINGRRTPDANHNLKATFTGMNLSTDAVRLFKAIVEATSFGSKAIVDRFIEEGVPIREVIAIGGVAKKSPFVMQNLSDVLNVPIRVAAADQACALGAAMFAAVVSGIYPDVKTAQEKMGSGFDREYTPRPEFVEIYQKLYAKYQKLGNITNA